MPWWVWDYNSKGRPVLVNNFNSEEMAQEFIEEGNLSRLAEKFYTPTKDPKIAKRYIKAHLIREKRDLDEGMKRFASKKTLVEEYD